MKIVSFGCVGTLVLVLLASSVDDCQRCTERGGVLVSDFWGVPRCLERR